LFQIKIAGVIADDTVVDGYNEDLERKKNENIRK
jgi:hypothetical protein